MDGVVFTFKTLDKDEKLSVFKSLSQYDELEAIGVLLQIETLKRSIISVDNAIIDPKEIEPYLRNLPLSNLTLLHNRQEALEAKLSELRNLVEDFIETDESQVRAKVLITMKWSPLDERVQRLSDIHWKWLYRAIIKQEQEEKKEHREQQTFDRDLILQFINPQIYQEWKSNQEATKVNSGFTESVRKHISPNIDADIIMALENGASIDELERIMKKE
jgi:hypothetical protein